MTNDATPGNVPLSDLLGATPELAQVGDVVWFRAAVNEYRIKSSGLGPATYGTCERCGKQCPCHYMQQWRKQGQTRGGWATAGFGHVECLRTGPWAEAPVTHDSRA